MHAHCALSYRNHIVYSNTVISRDKLLYVSVGGVCEENFGQLWARKGEKDKRRKGDDVGSHVRDASILRHGTFSCEKQEQTLFLILNNRQKALILRCNMCSHCKFWSLELVKAERKEGPLQILRGSIMIGSQTLVFNQKNDKCILIKSENRVAVSCKSVLDKFQQTSAGKTWQIKIKPNQRKLSQKKTIEKWKSTEMFIILIMIYCL